MRVIKFLLKIISIILLLAVFALAAYFIIYPNKAEIELAIYSANVQNISRNSSLQILTKLSPQKYDAYVDNLDDETALEHVTREELLERALITNEGEFIEALEEFDTKVTVSSASIDAYVHDGIDGSGMDDGPWHFPLSASPGEVGNFVIIGHRFGELPPSTNTFFLLDKIKVGDKIYITQEDDISYTYTVIETKVVEKTDRSILKQTNDRRITLVTCTPLWTANQRHVIVGLLDRAYSIQ